MSEMSVFRRAAIVGSIAGDGDVAEGAIFKSLFWCFSVDTFGGMPFGGVDFQKKVWDASSAHDRPWDRKKV